MLSPPPTSIDDKPRWPATTATLVAEELCRELIPVCVRLIVAGSLRRQRPTVGDLELLYIPEFSIRPKPGDLFAVHQVNLVDEVLVDFEAVGILEKRRNTRGATMYGEKNKFMRHCATGLPVDLFAATADNWWNYLVCRTGPAESNLAIATAAKERGWHWNPYGPGFSRGGQIRRMDSEEAVFAFVGLPSRPPDQR